MDEATKQRLIEDYEYQLDDMGVGDFYDARSMIDVRADEVRIQLTEGEEAICLKVPSYRETFMDARLARVLLDELDVRRRRRGW